MRSRLYGDIKQAVNKNESMDMLMEVDVRGGQWL